jgi:hypothetical protein
MVQVAPLRARHHKGAIMDNLLRRTAGAAGLVAVASLVANLAFTTDGPRPDLPAATEAARAVSQAGQLRVSAILLVVFALAVGVMLLVLADLVPGHAPGRRLGAGVLRFAAGIATAVLLVSAATLAAVPEVAQSQLTPDLVTGLGDVHTTLFFANAPVFGMALLLVAWLLADVVPRWTCWLAAVVGACGVLSCATLGVEDFDLGGGWPAAFGAPFFFGLPLWMVSTSIVLNLGRGARQPDPALA